jgi:hypothetical protein
MDTTQTQQPQEVRLGCITEDSTNTNFVQSHCILDLWESIAWRSLYHLDFLDFKVCGISALDECRNG